MSGSSIDCPYCNEKMEADFVDVGVGYVQCGPYHCYSCGASEIGPEYWDWHYKDREGETIYLPGKRTYFEHAKKKLINSNESVLRWDHPFTERELETGYYQGKISPYANSVDGQLVDHILAKEAYDAGLLDEKDLPKEDLL